MQNFIEKPTSKFKKAWEKQRQGLKNNAKVSKKTCRKTTARKTTSLWKNWQAQNKRELLPSRTKQGNVSKKNKTFWRGGQSIALYTHTTTGDPKVLDVPPPISSDIYPILREEVEATVKSPKKGKLAGVDNISIEAGPGRRRGHERYFTHHLQ